MLCCSVANISLQIRMMLNLFQRQLNTKKLLIENQFLNWKRPCRPWYSSSWIRNVGFLYGHTVVFSFVETEWRLGEILLHSFVKGQETPRKVFLILIWKYLEIFMVVLKGHSSNSVLYFHKIGRYIYNKIRWHLVPTEGEDPFWSFQFQAHSLIDKFCVKNLYCGVQVQAAQDTWVMFSRLCSTPSDDRKLTLTHKISGVSL